MAIPSFQDHDLERRIRKIQERRGDATLTSTVRSLLREKVVLEEAEIRGMMQSTAVPSVTSTRGGGA